jgi:hypothetical protein
MRPRVLAILLAAGGAFLPGAAGALETPPAVSASSAPAGGADWVLSKMADVFTSDSRIFGEVHLPVIASNPNSGVTYGVLPVWLVHNARHEITQIYAPMFTYNRTYGAAFSGSYYYYPSGQEKLRAVLEKSQRSNQRAALEYENRALFDGRAFLQVATNFEADGGVKFYGLGPVSSEGNEASERLIEDLVRAEFGWRFWGTFAASAAWKVRYTRVEEGPFDEPAPLPPSLQTATSFSLPRAALSRDTRDLPFTPTRGSLTELFAEYSNKDLGSSADYEHYGGQTRVYLPTARNLVTALHAQGEWSGGGDVPFTALSQLGGPRTLRGYAEGRFQDRGSAFGNVEERWTVHSIDLVHSITEMQIAPFLETGTVFPTPGAARIRTLATVGGVAFRVVVKPDVVGRVEIGDGREGPAVFVGIDYPF